MICKHMCLAAVTSDGQKLGVYLNVDCQKSAAICQSAPKKPRGYFTSARVLVSKLSDKPYGADVNRANRATGNPELHPQWCPKYGGAWSPSRSDMSIILVMYFSEWLHISVLNTVKL
uniref:Uncharacterized protein n=1 Tax=Timema douglasi TaxID=61478 RepID=A0A7R8W2E0_TIMDO|nr:unnamed protein product [Timema douglasi]